MSDGRIKPKAETRGGRELLAQWIVRGRLTQGEAAARIGISRVKLNQYLNAEARPSLETAIRIEDTTGIGMRAWLTADAPPVTDRNPPVTDRDAGKGVAEGRADREVNNNPAGRTH